MRKLLIDEIDNVADALEISSQIVEKDFRVVEILARIKKHLSLPKGVQLIFAGGTCLARAHKLVRRMSEDVDLKIVVDDNQFSSKNSRKQALKRFCNDIENILKESGFEAFKLEKRNQYQYIKFEIFYDAILTIDSVALRPHLLLELSAAPLRKGFVKRDIASFIAEAKKEAFEILDLECVSVEEIAAEKLISLTRRMALFLQNPDDIAADRFLIRHIYDLHQIISQDDIDISEISKLAAEIALADAEQFSRQFPSYKENPSEETTLALKYLKESPEAQEAYSVFLREMVYGEKIAFNDAFRSVERAGKQLLSHLSSFQNGGTDV